MIAAELALGLLDGEPRTAALRRAGKDSVFAARIGAWERRFAPLAYTVAEVAPPPSLWNRIAVSVGAPVKVVPLRPRARRWDDVRIWRFVAAAGFAAAAASLVALILEPAPRPPTAPTPSPVMVASLASPEGRTLFVATFDRSRSGMTITPVGDIAFDGRSPELWIIPTSGRPLPVAVLRGAQAQTIAASTVVIGVAAPTVTLAVSLEPPGGSKTGAPTGPVIASGPLTMLRDGRADGGTIG